MSDEQLSRDMREILGAWWCVDREIECGLMGSLGCCTGLCARSIAPSPAVAYALAEQLNATLVASYQLESGSWRCEAALGDGDANNVEVRGPTRAHAECRAMVALAKRKEAA